MAVTIMSKNHVDRALNFYNSYSTNNVWVGIGNPPTGSWQAPYSDTSPPVPSSSLQALDNPIGYKLLSQVNLVYPSSSGSITYNGQSWTTCDPLNAYLNNAYFVYFSGTLTDTDLPTNIYYREIGLFANLQLVSGYTGSSATPDKVASVGELILVEYTGPIYRNSGQQEIINYIISF